MSEWNFWMKCHIRSGECLWLKIFKSYLRWVLWISTVNQYEEAMTNEQSQYGGYQIDEITYGKSGESD